MSMYNKIFTKILDSSIWSESESTRIVWVTFIAAMDENGFVQFAGPDNVANRARVTLKKAETAIDILQNPDPHSSDPDNEGRRIERVPGGWMVLNSQKYRALVTRAIIQEQTRLRVKSHRERRKSGNVSVTQKKRRVTPSEVKADTEAKAERTEERPALDGKPLDESECPSCQRAGSLKMSQGRGGNPPGFWCDKRGGCGANWPLNTEAILSQMTSRGRSAIEAMLPAAEKPYVSPGMILTSELKFDAGGMLIE